MERMTKEEAAKELSYNVYFNDEEWNSLEDFIHNAVSFIFLEPENSNLYLAAIAQDKLYNYLEKYWDMAEDAGWVRIVKVCKDCYDFITSGDESVEDVFIHFYGEEEGHVRFLDVKNCVENIEKNGNFWQEVPELLNSFSVQNCECCNTHLSGERFFMIFLGNKSL